MQNVFITFTKISLVFVTALLVTKHVNSQQLTSSEDLGKPQLTSSEDSGKLPMTSSDDSPINSDNAVEENTSIFDLRLGNNDNNITEDTDARKSEHLLRIVNGDAVNLGHLPFMVRKASNVNHQLQSSSRYIRVAYVFKMGNECFHM